MKWIHVQHMSKVAKHESQQVDRINQPIWVYYSCVRVSYIVQFNKKLKWLT